MAITTYNYSVSGDTLNAIVAISELDEEIRSSSIVTALESVHVLGDNIEVAFKEAISTPDETTLDNIIAAHDGSISITEVVDVKVLEENIEVSKRTGGHFKATSLEISAPATVGESSHDFTFPYNISMLSIEYVGHTENNHDEFSVLVSPDTIIGAITSDVSNTDTVINVQPSVIDNAFIGMLCKITDLTNTDDLGYILEIDNVANTITVSTAATQSFLAATPTYVQISVEVIKDIIIDETTAPTQVGGSKIGGSFLAANTTIRIIYDNKDGVAKDFHAIMELLY